MLPEWFFVCLIGARYFGAELTDAGAGGLSHRVVVGLRLKDVEVGHLVSIPADHLLALLAEDLAPSVVAVHPDAFCHIVPVEAHPRHKQPIVLVKHCVIATRCLVERSGAKGSSIPHL